MLRDLKQQTSVAEIETDEYTCPLCGHECQEISDNYDEKKYIVENIFRDYLKCSSVEFERFFARCSKANIADFSQLINDYRKSMVSSCFDNIDIIDDVIINNISRYVETRKEKIDYKLLIQFA